MGPRSRDRGITASKDKHGYGWLLQWGRGHVTAESARWLSAPAEGSWLQWGRGHVTAESSWDSHKEREYFVASMGPRSRDRGIADSLTSQVVSGLCFNGAAVT